MKNPPQRVIETPPAKQLMTLPELKNLYLYHPVAASIVKTTPPKSTIHTLQKSGTKPRQKPEYHKKLFTSSAETRSFYAPNQRGLFI